jgi:glycosyltransferase involved in cell wall biosynthesis
MYRSIAADGRMELMVVFAERGATPSYDSGFGRVIQWQDDLVAGFPHTVVTAEAPARPKAVLEALKAFAPDAVYVHGYDRSYMREAMDWAQSGGIPVLMTTDSELLHARPWYTLVAKRLILPRILAKVDLFLTVGDENERYYGHYGVSKDRFHRVPFSIDSTYYENILANRGMVRAALRQKLGIADDAVVFLTVGKMIPRKCHADLIRGFAKAIESAKRPAVLLIAGDGPDRAMLEELAKPLGEKVKLLGFIGVDKLPEYYVAADVYTHPSSFDPHPLAISEALYCSLPAAVSDRIGSIGETDDVQVGRNGWSHPHGDVAALGTILAEAIDDAEFRASAANLSRELGLLHASDRCGKLFVDGALLAIERRRAR